MLSTSLSPWGNRIELNHVAAVHNKLCAGRVFGHIASEIPRRVRDILKIRNVAKGVWLDSASRLLL